MGGMPNKLVELTGEAGASGWSTAMEGVATEIVVEAVVTVKVGMVEAVGSD